MVDLIKQDYILHMFMCHRIWVLNNAIWLDTNILQIGDGITGGDAYREVEDTYNRNWELKIYNTSYRYDGDPLGTDKLIYLEGDAIPIIFRRQHNMAERSRTWFIIYDGVIRDELTIEGGVYWPSLSRYNIDRIWRVGSIYYCIAVGDVRNLSFDYGLIKKPVKVEFTQIGDTKTSRFRNPDWYYTEPLGDVNIF